MKWSWNAFCQRGRISVRILSRNWNPRPDRVLTVARLALDYLAVHPENQGKGIGTALVQSGIRHAEQLRLPIFILAFKAGRSIYERLGFREVDRVIQDDTKYGGEGEYSAYFMVYGVPTKPRSRQE